MATIDPSVRELAQAPNFATLSVILRSGGPMTHVMWVDADDDHVMINTEVPGRSLGRAARPARHGHDLAARRPVYLCRGARPGRRDLRGPEARAHIDRLSRKYRGKDYDGSAITSERVILRIAPETVRIH